MGESVLGVTAVTVNLLAGIFCNIALRPRQFLQFHSKATWIRTLASVTFVMYGMGTMAQCLDLILGSPLAFYDTAWSILPPFKML